MSGERQMRCGRNVNTPRIGYYSIRSDNVRKRAMSLSVGRGLGGGRFGFEVDLFRTEWNWICDPGTHWSFFGRRSEGSSLSWSKHLLAHTMLRKDSMIKKLQNQRGTTEYCKLERVKIHNLKLERVHPNRFETTSLLWCIFSDLKLSDKFTKYCNVSHKVSQN